MCWGKEDYKVFDEWKGQVSDELKTGYGKPLSALVGRGEESKNALKGVDAVKGSLYVIFRAKYEWGKPVIAGTTPAKAATEIAALVGLEPLAKKKAGTGTVAKQLVGAKR